VKEKGKEKGKEKTTAAKDDGSSPASADLSGGLLSLRNSFNLTSRKKQIQDVGYFKNMLIRPCRWKTVDFFYFAMFFRILI
jgi:hypothetical protein